MPGLYARAPSAPTGNAGNDPPGTQDPPENPDDRPSPEDIARWQSVLHPADHAVEIRAPKTVFSNVKGEANIVKRFAPGKLEAMAKEARRLCGQAPAVYVVMNGVDPALPTTGRLAGGAKAENVPRRCRILFDCDPTREGTVNATEGEKAEGLKLLEAVRAHLRGLGFPEPVTADSGNGFHLVYAIDLPNDDESTALVKAVLESVAARFDTATAKVDTKVHDAPRLVKLYGTFACKGENTSERPGRYSRVLTAPAELNAIPIELLRRVVAEAPAPPAAFDLDAAIEQKRAQTSDFVVPPTPTNGRPDAEERAALYLERCEPSVSGKKGHNKAFKAACKIGPGFDLTPEATLRLLRRFNERCVPAWTDREMEHKVSEAFKVETRRGFLLHAERQPAAERASTHTQGSAASSVGLVGASVEEIPKFEGGPTTLTMDLLAVPPLPPGLIPEAIRDWLTDIAKRGSFPLEYPAASAVVGLASLVGRNLAIRPKKHDAWTVVPNLWGAIVGPPGLQKTPAVEETFLPLKRLIAEAIEAHAEAEQRAIGESALAEAKASAAKKRVSEGAKKGLSDDTLRQLIAEATPQEPIAPPTPKRYVVNDATVEKLGELLRENPRGLLQFRDELSGWLKSMDRQGHESDRGFYLESWNGNGNYTFDRIGRGTVFVKALCLSIFGTIQPGPLARYLKGAAAGDDADGFVPRFQILLYPDPPSKFVNVDVWPDTGAKNRAFEVFRWIDSLSPEMPGTEFDEDRGLYFIRFDDGAQALFDEWRIALEDRLRSGSEGTLLTCHLAKYRSLMPSLALLFHVIDSAGAARIEPVTKEAAERAAAWCELLEAHARRIYQSAVEGDPEAASRLAERIKQSLPNPFTFRQVAIKGWAGLDDVESVRKAVGILEDRNWAKVVVHQPAGGGRPSERVWINPHVRGDQGGDS